MRLLTPFLLLVVFVLVAISTTTTTVTNAQRPPGVDEAEANMILGHHSPNELSEMLFEKQQELENMKDSSASSSNSLEILDELFPDSPSATLKRLLTVNNKDDPSSSYKKIVLVIGAHGGTGQKILEELVAFNEGKSYLPLAMVRTHEQEDVLNSHPLLKNKILTTLGDIEYPFDSVFETQQQLHPLAGTDPEKSGIHTVIFAAGSKGKNVANVDLGGAIRAIDTAKKYPSVKRFIMLSGTNVAQTYKSSSVGLKQWGRGKWYADEFLRDSANYYSPTYITDDKIEPGSPGAFDWTIVCPSTLTDEETDKVVGRVDIGPEYLVSRDLPNFAVTTKGKGIWRKNAKSSRRNVAKVIVESIDEPSTFKKTFRVLDGEEFIGDALKKL